MDLFQTENTHAVRDHALSSYVLQRQSSVHNATLPMQVQGKKINQATSAEEG